MDQRIRSTIFAAVAALVLSAGAFGCGSSNSTSTATIKISSPTAGAMVAAGTDADKSVPVTFTVTNFTLMAPGACGSVADTCGHVHLLIDGTACNVAPSPYNNAGATSPISVDPSAPPSEIIK